MGKTKPNLVIFEHMPFDPLPETRPWQLAARYAKKARPFLQSLRFEMRLRPIKRRQSRTCYWLPLGKAELFRTPTGKALVTGTSLANYASALDERAVPTFSILT
jgi:hypothetical protein